MTSDEEGDQLAEITKPSPPRKVIPSLGGARAALTARKFLVILVTSLSASVHNDLHLCE